jgi:ribose-phosphate pyrophosphokinase
MILINGDKLQQDHFPDKTLNIKVYENHKTCVDIQWNYENDAELFTIICLRKHFEGKIVTLTMPYLPHARMDRVKRDEDVFTLKYFCETINSLNFKKVIILDPHSNVGPALLDRVEIRSAESAISSAIGEVLWDIGKEEDLAVFYPDEGSMKRYSDFAQLPYGFGVKKRDWTTGKIQNLEIINAPALRDKAVLIIDDICSRGGTFYHSAKAIKEYTDKDIYLYITHCEETIFEGELFKNNLIKKIFVANPLFEIPTEYLENDLIVQVH